MQAEEVTIGMRVRYPRTGTTGKVLGTEVRQGSLFVELDSTHLLYRVDQLVPVGMTGDRAKASGDDRMEQVKKERDFFSGAGFQEAISHIDQSCEGGG